MTLIDEGGNKAAGLVTTPSAATTLIECHEVVINFVRLFNFRGRKGSRHYLVREDHSILNLVRHAGNHSFRYATLRETRGRQHDELD